MTVFGDDAVAVVSWDGTTLPSRTDTTTVGDGPVGLDLRVLDHGDLAIVATGFGDGTLSESEVAPDGAVRSTETRPAPDGCVQPRHAIYVRDAAGLKVVVSRYGSGQRSPTWRALALVASARRRGGTCRHAAERRIMTRGLSVARHRAASGRSSSRASGRRHGMFVGLRCRVWVGLVFLVAPFAVADENPIAVSAWTEFFADFASATVPAAVLSTLPAELDTITTLLFASDDVTRVSLLVWLHRKSVDAVIADDWTAHERFEEFFGCLAIGSCERLDELLALDPVTGDPVADPSAAQGWDVAESSRHEPRCEDERITFTSSGEQEVIVRIARGDEPDDEVAFGWSEPYADDGWLWIDLELLRRTRPITLRLIATFSYGESFERRMSSQLVGAVDGDATFETTGIPIVHGLDHVVVSLDVFTTFECGRSFEDRLVQRYLVRRDD